MIDIIIPTYNNPEALERTLKSIPNLPELHPYIVDDCSKVKYPPIEMTKLSRNVGPGLARQYGIEHTSHDYIMFLDSGDYIIAPDFSKILETIRANPDIYMFSYLHTFRDGQKETHANNRLHGRIYKRSFLTDYSISFAPEGSRANEDVGFNHLCRIILLYLYNTTGMNRMLTVDEPIVHWHYDADSITHRDNAAFIFKKQNMGTACNFIHVYHVLKKNNLPQEYIACEITSMVPSLYYRFLNTAIYRPEFMQDMWDGARHFYTALFDKNALGEECLTTYYNFMMDRLMRGFPWKFNFPPNLKQFLQDLRTHRKVPKHYYFKRPK